MSNRAGIAQRPDDEYTLLRDAYDRIEALERAVSSRVEVVTSIPSIGYNGQEIAYIFTDAFGKSNTWKFRYNENAAGGSSFKWEFIGGPPMTVLDPNQYGPFTWTSPGNVNTWIDIVTSLGGSSFAVLTTPLTGDYIIQINAAVYSSVTGALLYYAPGITGPLGFTTLFNQPVGNFWSEFNSPPFSTSLTAGQVIRAFYQTNSASVMYVNHQYISLIPKRVSA